MTLEKAIAALRVRQLAAVEEDVALDVVFKETLRMRKALAYYADLNNYLDGVPMLKDLDTGLLSVEDDGMMAREALRMNDYLGLPLIKLSEAA